MKRVKALLCLLLAFGMLLSLIACGVNGDEVVERIEAPAMWEQMCFKPDRIKGKNVK